MAEPVSAVRHLSVETEGRRRAARDRLQFCPFYMLRSYLLLSLRTLRRHPYAAINVLGLTVGIASCLLIAMFVRHEFIFDRHHEHADRIVRVTTRFSDASFPMTALVAGPTLNREIPEVQESVRLLSAGTFGSAVVGRHDHMFEEERLVYADSSIFDVFTLPLSAGDSSRALTRPRTIVLSEASARRYFGERDPVGETLFVNQAEFEVTGVLEPLVATSHLQFDLLASFTSLSWADDEDWMEANYSTYLLVRSVEVLDGLPRKIERVVDRARASGSALPNGYELRLEPLKSIRLDAGGRRPYVYFFSAVAALILLIACTNYASLVTARATQRAKEVGVRKVVGAARGQLVRQFYAEAALLSGISVVMAVALASLLMPTFRAISGQAVALNLDDPHVILGLLIIGALVTVATGSYPAVLLSSFAPATGLKGMRRRGRGISLFRRALVTFQFALAVFLFVGTAVIYSQLRYVLTADLGFRGQNVVALPMGDSQTLAALPEVKRRLREQRGVLNVTAIDRLPGTQPGGYSLAAEGFELPVTMDYYPMHAVPTEAGVVETLGLEVVAGRDFRTPESSEQDTRGYEYLINEATLMATGWSAEDAIGKRFTVSGGSRWGVVVGVFRDYHFMPLREAVGPLALFNDPSQVNNLLVRLSENDERATLGRIESVWRDLVPHRPFTYTFLDDAFVAHYESDRQLAKIFAAFSMLAIFVACTGLLGLAAFVAEQRRKEIGLRLVLGAGITHVIVLLSKEFAVLVAIAFAIAAPLAYPLMSRWLDGFAYHVSLEVEMFLVAGAVVLLLSMATVSIQSLRAATTEPAEVLRAE